MGKETKVGLFVIMLLLLLFGVVVVQKVRSGSATAVAGQETHDAADSEPESSDPVRQASTGGSDEPTIVEPEVFTPPSDLEEPAAYSDASGLSSSGLGIPDAAEVGLGGAGDESASPAHRFMPGPTVDMLPSDTHSGIDTARNLAGEPEPARFNTGDSRDPFGEAHVSPPGPRRKLAAIGVDNRSEQSPSQEQDPFATTEEDSSWPDLPDNVGSDVHASNRATAGVSDPRDGRTWSTEVPAATGYEPTPSTFEGDLMEDELADAPSLELPAVQSPSYSENSRYSATGGDYGSGPGALTLPDVPPAIDDLDPPGETQPLLSADSRYVVKENDSFWTISVKQYGTGRFFMALHLHNQETVPVPEKLRPGMRISTPPPATLQRLYPESISRGASDPSGTALATGADESAPKPGPFRDSAGGKRYRVGPSDTLFDIAKGTLGQGTQWRVIYELNRDRIEDPDRLKPGMVLRLPDSARISQVANNPPLPLR